MLQTANLYQKPFIIHALSQCNLSTGGHRLPMLPLEMGLPEPNSNFDVLRKVHQIWRRRLDIAISSWGGSVYVLSIDFDLVAWPYSRVNF